MSCKLLWASFKLQSFLVRAYFGFRYPPPLSNCRKTRASLLDLASTSLSKFPSPSLSGLNSNKNNKRKNEGHQEKSHTSGQTGSTKKRRKRNRQNSTSSVVSSKYDHHNENALNFSHNNVHNHNNSHKQGRIKIKLKNPRFLCWAFLAIWVRIGTETARNS